MIFQGLVTCDCPASSTQEFKDYRASLHFNDVTVADYHKVKSYLLKCYLTLCNYYKSANSNGWSSIARISIKKRILHSRHYYKTSQSERKLEPNTEGSLL